MPVTPAEPCPDSHHSDAEQTVLTAQLAARMGLRLKRSIRSPAGSSSNSMGMNCARPT